MPERVILVIAKEYGVSPHVVETEWPLYWFNRAVELLAAENILHEKRLREMDRKRGR